MGESLRSYASLGRLDLNVPEFTFSLSPEEKEEEEGGGEGAPVTRRKSSVRFLDQVRTIRDGGEPGEMAGPGGEAAAAAPLRGRQATNHSWCSFAVGGEPRRGRRGGGTGDGKTAPCRPGERAAGDDAASRRTERRDREARMEQNIEWIRDEIAKMKQQDQSLMRQFLQLRSVIYQLKGAATTGQGPAAKLPRIAASVESFSRYESEDQGLASSSSAKSNFFLPDGDADELREMDDQLALTEDPYLPEFRGRTVSLLNPGNQPGARAAGAGGFGYLKSRTMSFSVGTSERELDRAIVE